MWEFTPPPGTVMQQWQTSFRLLFKEDRIEEMLAWFELQLEICKEAAASGKFYNEQPRQEQHRVKNRDRDKPRPVAVHGTRRREPRRGEDDEADPNSPPPPKRPQRATGGNVQADGGPMPSMSPNMARTKAGTPVAVTSAVAGKTPAPKRETPADDKGEEIEALRKRLAELEGTEETAPDTQPRIPTNPPPPVEETEEQAPQAQGPDLSGPRIHRHKWSANRYEIDSDNSCTKCGTVCTGTEELCPVP